MMCAVLLTVMYPQRIYPEDPTVTIALSNNSDGKIVKENKAIILLCNTFTPQIKGIPEDT